MPKASPSKAPLPKKPREPKKVKDVALNTMRVADYQAKLAVYEEEMAAYKEGQRERKADKRSAKQRLSASDAEPAAKRPTPVPSSCACFPARRRSPTLHPTRRRPALTLATAALALRIRRGGRRPKRARRAQPRRRARHLPSPCGDYRKSFAKRRRRRRRRSCGDATAARQARSRAAANAATLSPAWRRRREARATSASGGSPLATTSTFASAASLRRDQRQGGGGAAETAERRPRHWRPRWRASCQRPVPQSGSAHCTASK